jgi:hypothetical protein
MNVTCEDGVVTVAEYVLDGKALLFFQHVVRQAAILQDSCASLARY